MPKVELSEDVLKQSIDILKDYLSNEELHLLEVFCGYLDYATYESGHTLEEKHKAAKEKIAKNKQLFESRITIFRLEHERELEDRTIQLQLRELENELSYANYISKKIDKLANKISCIRSLLAALNTTKAELNFSDPQDAEPLEL